MSKGQKTGTGIDIVRDLKVASQPVIGGGACLGAPSDIADEWNNSVAKHAADGSDNGADTVNVVRMSVLYPE